MIAEVKIPLTYKAISPPHLRLHSLPSPTLQSWKNIISAEPWEERMAHQLWLLTNQLSTINYSTNQFIRLLGSSLSGQLLGNVNTDDKKSQSRTLITMLGSMKHYSEWNKLSYSTARKSRSQMLFNCMYTSMLSGLTAMDLSPSGASLQTREGSFCSTKLKMLINAVLYAISLSS